MAERTVLLVAALTGALALGCQGFVDGGADGATPGGPGAVGGSGAGGGVGAGGDATRRPGEAPAGLKCDAPSVGVRPLPRLTRAQYENSVRDWLGVTVDFRALLPEDEQVGAFFQNRSTPVSTHDVEVYRGAAEAVAAAAVQDVQRLASCAEGQNEACAQRLIDEWGALAHRRPLTSKEQQLYRTVFASQAEAGFAAGLGAVLEAMLQSPHFLYRLEPASGASAGVRQLGGYELASRLSFLLWNGPPDAALLERARTGTLVDAEQLRAETTRMLADDRAARTVATFQREWLGLWRLSSQQKSAELFPGYDAGAALVEADDFAAKVLLRGDGRVASLLTAPFTAQLDGTARVGMLTLPAFLASTAHAEQTSTVRRGAVVRTHLLCSAPPSPPVDADITPPEPRPGATTRERFAEHTASPTCAACHALMDPIGFAFEGYDAVGKYRATEQGLAIDTSGAIMGTVAADAKFNGADELARHLASNDQVRECIATTWFEYGFGRKAEAADSCAFWEAYGAYRAADYDVRALLTGFITSDAFRSSSGG